jgi:hypothetical protein
MKNLQTQSSHKYVEAFVELQKRIEKNSLNQNNFRREFELPQNFIRACCNLNLIGRCCNGRYTNAFNNEIKEVHGRMISLEIVHMEKIRLIKFKITNNEN